MRDLRLPFLVLLFAPLFGTVLPGTAGQVPEAPSTSAAPLTVYVDSGDDQTINAAIAGLPAAGGTIVLGPSQFVIGKPIVIDRDGVELRGIGRETTLRLADGSNCSVVIVGSTSTPVARIVRNVKVGHLVIDGNRATQQFECCGGPCDTGAMTYIRNNGITIRGAEDVRVENVVTHNCRSGGIVLEKVCRRIHIIDLDSYNNEFDGLAAYETEDSIFEQLNLHNNRSAGLSIDWKFNRNLVLDSSFTDNGSQGLFMRDSNENVFRNLYLRDNGEQGVFVAETREIADSACRRNRFERIRATGNKTQGIRINDVSCVENVISDSRIAGNTIENISLAAIGLLIGAEAVLLE